MELPLLRPSANECLSVCARVVTEAAGYQCLKVSVLQPCLPQNNKAELKVPHAQREERDRERGRECMRFALNPPESVCVALATGGGLAVGGESLTNIPVLSPTVGLSLPFPLTIFPPSLPSSTISTSPVIRPLPYSRPDPVNAGSDRPHRALQPLPGVRAPRPLRLPSHVHAGSRGTGSEFK